MSKTIPGVGAGRARTEASRPSELWGITREVVAECREDRVTGLAAEIAFFAVLGFFPGVLAVGAALGFLGVVLGPDQADRMRDATLEFLSSVLTDKADRTVDSVRDLFTDSSPGFLALGLAGAVLGASRAFLALIRGLDTAYDLEERRGYVQTRVTAVALALGTVAIAASALAVLVLGPLLGSGQAVAGELGFGGAFATFWDWLRWPTAVVVLVAWTALLFHFAPFHRAPWRSHLPGAVLSSATWLAVSFGLQVYLAAAGGMNPVLGTLGGALILLVWLYALALGLLAGGELNAVLSARSGIPQRLGNHWHFRRSKQLWRRIRSRWHESSGE